MEEIDFETEDAELESALTMATAEDLGERAYIAAEDGRWYAAAVLSVATWRKANGLRVAAGPVLTHIGMLFGRPPTSPPPED